MGIAYKTKEEALQGLTLLDSSCFSDLITEKDAKKVKNDTVEYHWPVNHYMILSGGVISLVEENHASYTKRQRAWIIPLDDRGMYTQLSEKTVGYSEIVRRPYGASNGVTVDYFREWLKGVYNYRPYQYANPASPSAIKQEQATAMSRFFDSLHHETQVRWNGILSERIREIRKSMKEDPAFAAHVETVGAIEKTQETLQVVAKLSRLRSCLDSIISGIEKSSLSEETVHEYSSMVRALGSDRRDIVAPLRKFFVKKPNKK